MWGAAGNLTDPAGELAAFWKAFDPFASLLGDLAVPPDDEPTGPLDGYLQCDGRDTCAWADYSGIVVVSQSSPSDPGTIVTSGSDSGQADPFFSEETLAGLTKSFRDMAELPRHDTGGSTRTTRT